MGQLGPVSSLGFWGLFLVLGVSSLTLLIRPGILMFPVPIAFRAEAFMSDPEPTGRSKRARGIWQLPDLMRAAKADGHRGRKWSQPWGECEPLAQLAVTFPELWNICQPLPTPVPVTWLPLFGPKFSIGKAKYERTVVLEGSHLEDDAQQYTVEDVVLYTLPLHSCG